MSKTTPAVHSAVVPAPGAAPGATHNATSLRETTASMRSLIQIIIPCIVLYKTRVKNLFKIRKKNLINQ